MKRKILYVITQSEWGGAQRYVLDLATAFKDEFSVAIACGGEGPLIARARSAGIKTFALTHLIRPIRPWEDYRAVRELRWLIRRMRPDVVHTNSTKAEIVGNLAARLEHVPVVFTAHGFVLNEPMSRAKRFAYAWVERLANRRTARIICVSDCDRATGIRFRIAPEGKLTTIHNGVDRFDEIGNHAITGVGEKTEPVVGTVASLCANKGYAHLLNAVSILGARDMRPPFRIVGEGEMRPLLEEIVRKKHLANVELVGFRADPIREMIDFDIFVLSSLKEGFPYVILEAMAAGLPIVATRVGGIPEAVIEGKGGFLVDPGDAKGLASKIAALIGSPELRRSMGEFNRTRVREEFSIERMISQTRKVYDDVRERKNPFRPV